MNCERFAGLITDLARHGVMEAHLRDQLLNHTGGCQKCALRLEEERALTVSLRMVAEDMKPLQASGNLEGSLRLSFRSQMVLDARRKERRRQRWVTAAAAAVLIALGVIVSGWRLAPLFGRKAESQMAAQVNNAPSAEAASNGSLPEKRPEDVVEIAGRATTPTMKRGPQHAKRRAKRSLVVAASESADFDFSQSEIATDFLPLSYGGTMSLQDGGQIVRVELPRSALLNFGLPVNMARVDERVKADVVVGADGLAHAIRFVQ